MTFGLLSQILTWGGWLGLVVALGGGVTTLLARRPPPVWVWFVVPMLLSWGAWLGLGALPAHAHVSGALDYAYAWALWQVTCDQIWPMMLTASLHGLVLFHPALRKQSPYESLSLVLPGAFLFVAGLLLSVVSAALVEADLHVEQQLAGVTLGALVPCLLCGVRSEDPAWRAARGSVIALYGLSVLFVLLDLHYLQLVFVSNAAAGLLADEARISGFQTLLLPVAVLGLGAVLLCAGRDWRSVLAAGLWVLPVLAPPLLWEGTHQTELHNDLHEAPARSVHSSAASAP